MSKLKNCLIAGIILSLVSGCAAPRKTHKLDLEAIAHAESIDTTRSRQESIKYYGEIIKKDPNNWKAHLELAEAYIQGSLDNYLEDAEQAIKHYTSSLQLKQTQIAYFHRGEAYRVLGKKSQTLEDHLTATKLWSDDFMTWRHLAQTYVGIRDFRKSNNAYKKILSLDKKDIEKYCKIRNYGILDVLIGTYAGMINNYGMLKEHDKAIKYANKIINLMPDKSTGYRERAMIHEEAGNYNKAIQDYKKVLSINKDPFCQEELEKLQKLIQQPF